MRIAELSRQSDVPVATIKYYLREGLLPQGELTSPNQAHYDERHLRRLRLVRALVEIGRLPIAAIRDLLAGLDTPRPDLHEALGRALAATSGPRGDIDAAASGEIAALIERRGWAIHPDTPAARAAAEAVAALRALGAGGLVKGIDGYAEAAELIAAQDLALIKDRQDAETTVLEAVVGTIIGDTLIVALRRMAQESASAAIFGRRP